MVKKQDNNLEEEDEELEDAEEKTDEEIGEDEDFEEDTEKDEDSEEDAEDPDADAVLTFEEDEEELPASPKGANRFQKLSNRARDAEARAEAAQRQLEDFRAQQLVNSRGNQAAQREEYLASLSSDERRLFLIEEGIQQQQHQIAIQEFKYKDEADKAEYNAKAVKNPIFAKYADKVEAALHDIRTNMRMNAPRERILYNIIGELVVKQKMKPVSKKAANTRMQKNKAKPSGSGRSDVQGTKRGAKTDREARMERLENAKF
jgi:hypothetical protein